MNRGERLRQSTQTTHCDNPAPQFSARKRDGKGHHTVRQNLPNRPEIVGKSRGWQITVAESGVILSIVTMSGACGQQADAAQDKPELKCSMGLQGV